MKLEKYIQDNRDAFDDEPSAELWMAIHTKIPKKTKTIPLYIKSAAAIIMFIGIGYILGLKTSQKEINELAQYDSALVAYSKKIDQKKEKLASLVSNQPELSFTFDKDLEELQLEFEDLKAQLPHNPNSEILIEAMIKNLEWQIDLLNQQTKIAEKRTVNYL